MNVLCIVKQVFVFYSLLYSCWDCDRCYIDETRNALSSRIMQHEAAFWLLNVDKYHHRQACTRGEPSCWLGQCTNCSTRLKRQTTNVPWELAHNKVQSAVLWRLNPSQVSTCAFLPDSPFLCVFQCSCISAIFILFSFLRCARITPLSSGAAGCAKNRLKF